MTGSNSISITRELPRVAEPRRKTTPSQRRSCDRDWQPNGEGWSGPTQALVATSEWWLSTRKQAQKQKRLNYASRPRSACTPPTRRGGRGPGGTSWSLAGRVAMAPMAWRRRSLDPSSSTRARSCRSCNSTGTTKQVPHTSPIPCSALLLTPALPTGLPHTYIKLFVRQHGTKMTEDELVHACAIEAAAVREKARLLLARRHAGDLCSLARMGLGCLCDASESRATATTVVVRDQFQMFLVPRKDVEAGDALTHYYNIDSLK